MVGVRVRVAAMTMAVAVAVGELELVPRVAHAQSSSSRGVPSLADASLETLMNIEVTSAAKHEQPLRQTAAAMFVLTQEDIRRSGAATIADALRLVPGLHVARIDSHRWAITARGFNQLFSNKLLVLLDGRSVYTPFFSGVHWDVQDTALEEIDRIEVIRGAGGTLWGANAVNGVINIITRSAAAAQGGAVTVAGGTEPRASATARYGGRVGAAAYRVFVKGTDVGASFLSDGARGYDGWNMARVGFRLDVGRLSPSQPGASQLGANQLGAGTAGGATRDAFMVQGHLYHGDMEDENRSVLFTPPYVEWAQGTSPVGGGMLQGTWSHRFADGSTLTTRAYVDHHARTGPIRWHEIADTIDAEAQHHRRFAERHTVVYGAGIRWIALSGRSNGDSTLTRFEEDSALVNVFVQDEIALARERLTMTVGTKVERNGWTGVNLQPNVRFLWTPTPRHAAWTSIARSVRTPSYLDRFSGVTLGIYVLPETDGLLATVRVNGNPEARNETMIAYEAGYRVAVSSRLSVDAAAYVNTFDHLFSVEVPPPILRTGPVPHVALNGWFDNRNAGRTQGVETAVTYQAAATWLLRGGYTWYRGRGHRLPGGTDLQPDLFLLAQPSHQVQVASRFSPRADLDLDLTAYGASRSFETSLPAFYGDPVPGWVRVDARVAWRPAPPLELALVGQNLFDARHIEFRGEFTGSRSTVARRAAVVRVAWAF